MEQGISIPIPFQYDLWNIDTFMRGVMVGICFFMAILMIVKLHSLRVSMSKATRKVHTAFIIVRHAFHSKNIPSSDFIF